MNSATQQLMKSLSEGSVNNVVLDEIDNKLNQTFWTIYNKRTLRKKNFEYLKKLTRNLQRCKYRLDSVDLQVNIENDLFTLTKSLKKAIEARCQWTMEEKNFLNALDLYHDGVKELELYQKGVQTFVRLARENYDNFYNSRNGVNQKVFTFDRFMSRFSSMRITYVASHGIIASNHLYFTNLGMSQ